MLFKNHEALCILNQFTFVLKKTWLFLIDGTNYRNKHFKKLIYIFKNKFRREVLNYEVKTTYIFVFNFIIHDFFFSYTQNSKYFL